MNCELGIMKGYWFMIVIGMKCRDVLFLLFTSHFSLQPPCLRPAKPIAYPKHRFDIEWLAGVFLDFGA